MRTLILTFARAFCCGFLLISVTFCYHVIHQPNIRGVILTILSFMATMIVFEVFKEMKDTK